MPIETFYFWKIIAALSIGTFAIRSSIIFLSAKIKISDRAKEIFSFIPAAILPALITPLVFFHQGTVDLFLGKERMIVLMLATVVCYFTKSMLVTICFGLITLYAITSLGL